MTGSCQWWQMSPLESTWRAGLKQELKTKIYLSACRACFESDQCCATGRLDLIQCSCYSWERKTTPAAVLKMAAGRCRGGGGEAQLREPVRLRWRPGKGAARGAQRRP